jgi:phosphohistidine phosphatase SixA
MNLWPGIRTITFVAIVLLSFGRPDLGAAGQLEGDTQPKLSGTTLIKELKKGGYIIYFRHGLTSEFGEKDVADTDLDDCARQRNLSEDGQRQTKNIGQAFRQLQIPIGQVYSSPYCRCIETAKNLFGKVEKTRALHFAIHLRNAERATVTSQLLNLLGTPPGPGTNTAMISHTANLQEAVGVWPKPEGVAHVFKPGKDGQFIYVGMMQPDAWIAEADRLGGSKGWFTSVKGLFGGSRP